MMDVPESFVRTESLLGSDSYGRICGAKVAVFGVGGVGSIACEALARAGVKDFLLVDGDVVEKSNINRQLVALNSTIGEAKVSVMASRIRDINVNAKVETRAEFYSPQNADSFDLSGYDVIVDAIDNVAAKVELLVRAHSLDIAIVTSGGAANRVDPTKFKICDLMKTQGDGLARVVRQSLRKRGVEVHAPCVISDEQACACASLNSLVTVTASAGLLLAHAALVVLMEENKNETNNA